MYVTRIKLVNIRGFRDLPLNLVSANGTPRMRTLVIGKNGTCKTTLLRCVALGLGDEHDATALVAEDIIGPLIGESGNDATIELDVCDPERDSQSTTITTCIRRERRTEYAEKKSPPGYDHRGTLVCAYGIARFFSGGETFVREYRIADSVYSLFNYEQTTLAGIELTMRRLSEYLKPKVYEQVMNLLKSAIGLGSSDELGIIKGGGVFMREAYTRKKIPLAGWADGQRLMLLWLLDVFAWGLRARCISDEGCVRGILLIDELEQHVHPSIQRRLLGTLGRLLPRMQILATTHSPSVALGAAPNELVVLKKRRGKIFKAETPDFSGYSIEDITRDERLFDSDIYSPKFSRKLREYEQLISKPRGKRTATENRRLKVLVRDIAAKQMIPCEVDGALGELDRLVKKYDL